MHPADAKILKTAAIPTLILGTACTAIAAAVVGTKGALGAALATLIVSLFFSVGQSVLSNVVRNNPTMALTTAMMIYLAKVGVLLGFLLVFKDTDLFDKRAFGLTLLLLTLVWTAAEVWVFSKMNVLVVNDGRGGQSGDEISTTMGNPSSRHDSPPEFRSPDA